MENDIQVIKAKVGEHFVVAVPNKGTSGYEMTLDFDSSAFELVSFKNKAAAAFGGDGQTVFTFVAPDEVEGKIETFHQRPFKPETKTLAQAFFVKISPR